MKQIPDEQKLIRDAQYLWVDYRKATGSPPSYPSEWSPLWGAKVDKIEINHGNKPSSAIILFPALRWNESPECSTGDNIRIRTDAGTVVFMGFITSPLPSFSGSSAQGDNISPSSPAWERNAFVALSYRWLLATTSPIYGQFARGVDDYDPETGAPIPNQGTFLSGRHTIFNPIGRPNMDAISFPLDGDEDHDIYLFADPSDAESSATKYWTAKKMLRHLTSVYYNQINDLWPLLDRMLGFDEDDPHHEDWDKILNNIAAEEFNALDATMLICKHLGWNFREDYQFDDLPYLVFYKVGATATTGPGWTLRHQLYAPPVGEPISTAVAEGEKLLWAMEVAKDIESIINLPIGLGSPHRFEITAELVPGWLDSDLNPDTSEGNANLFFTEAQLQKVTNKNSKNYFKYYHPRGSNFRREVGRKWVLNESGQYTNPTTYNRGPLFNFADDPDAPVGRCGKIPDKYIVGPNFGRRLFAPFKRQLLPCLTLDKDNLNSIGIIVEFSFDKGQTWQEINCSVSSLKNECGIYIDEANLAELVDIAESTIVKEEGEGGALEGVQLNLFSSLCDDKLNERPYFDEEGICHWKTRVRVTASIQLDQRLQSISSPSSATGSPFLQSRLYDFSEKYGLIVRAPSSQFTSPAYELDSTNVFNQHLDAIRKANEDKSISGQFVLDRMWLGNKDEPVPEFMVGDCIEKIAGREYDLSSVMAAKGKDESVKAYPEIIQIIYFPEQQKQQLITRDLRFASVRL